MTIRVKLMMQLLMWIQIFIEKTFALYLLIGLEIDYSTNLHNYIVALFDTMFCQGKDQKRK